VDRLDTWLNAQRGGRRELLVWLWLSPLAAMIAAMTWASFEPAGPGLIIAALVVLVLLRVGTRTLMRARPSATPEDRDAKWTPPVFTWRQFAMIYLICPNIIINVLFWPVQSPGWEHWHQIHDNAELICSVCFLALVIGEIRYLRRLRQNSGGGIAGASG
jgi:hypothetical protein